MSEDPAKTSTPLAEAAAAEAETADKATHQALETLGKVATEAPRRITVDSSGVIMTPSDMKGELEYRQANGRKS